MMIFESDVLPQILSALGINSISELIIVDSLQLRKGHMPLFPPSVPAVIAPIGSAQDAVEIHQVLKQVYPVDHKVKLVHGVGTVQSRVQELPLGEIHTAVDDESMSALYLPALSQDSAFEAFQEIVAHLRAPDGCPWDKKQTHQSLRPHLLEETYETLDALDENNLSAMCEEFGDLLLQIVLHAQLAGEAGEFNMVNILQAINRKIVRRHPHVFGDVVVDGEGAVLQNWEKIKAVERRNNGEEQTKGLLDGVPKNLPALSQAQSYQDRAARVGFDWGDIRPVWDKVLEELNEVRSTENILEREAELGDLLFAVVNLVRWYGVDSESALRNMNQRFRRRFGYIEQTSRQAGRSLNEMNLQEMDVLWEEAKQLEKRQQGST